MRTRSHNPCVSPTASVTRLSRRAVLELLGVSISTAAMARHAWAGVPCGPSIARIDAFPVRYPMRGRFKFFEGPEGSPAGRPAVLVRITDQNGAIGWGESVPIPKWSDETLETVTTTITRYLAPELVGRDARAADRPRAGSHGERSQGEGDRGIVEVQGFKRARVQGSSRLPAAS
jgi:hypothetical protein